MNSAITLTIFPTTTFDVDAHHALARKAAEAGVVLLKNEDSVLPAKGSDMVLIGYIAKEFHYQGAGSSHINPTKLTSLTDALSNVPYTPCGNKDGKITEAELSAAAYAAKGAKVAIVVADLPDSYESEGFDRPKWYHWAAAPRSYEIRVRASSRDARLRGTLKVAGETVPAPDWQAGSWYETMAGAPSRSGWERVMGHAVPITPELKKGQFTLNSTCIEMKDRSFVMKLQYKVTEGNHT